LHPDERTNMNGKCIYRIDDVSPGMNWDYFYVFIDLFKKYNVVPLIGVVPDNRDPNLKIEAKEEKNFWQIIRSLQREGSVEVCQHGYQHLYLTEGIQLYNRICGFTAQSEFYGLSYKRQYSMIKKGMDILKENGLDVDTWMAPGHSFDNNTVKALKKLEFRAITDGIGVFPYKRKGITCVPQQAWGPEKSPVGIKTICLHLNNADEELYRRVEEHLKTCTNIVSFSSVLGGETYAHYYIINFIYKGVFILKILKRRLGESYRQVFPKGI
jgi:predicted deacetylase